MPVSLESINRGLMLPMSRESWVLKEAGDCPRLRRTVFGLSLGSQAPCISSPVKKDDWERSAVAAHFIAVAQVFQPFAQPCHSFHDHKANREACQGSSRPGSRQSSRCGSVLVSLKVSPRSVFTFSPFETFQDRNSKQVCYWSSEVFGSLPLFVI